METELEEKADVLIDNLVREAKLTGIFKVLREQHYPGSLAPDGETPAVMNAINELKFFINSLSEMAEKYMEILRGQIEGQTYQKIKEKTEQQKNGH